MYRPKFPLQHPPNPQSADDMSLNLSPQLLKQSEGYILTPATDNI